MPIRRVRRQDQLPYTDVGWISMRDHFVCTVGPLSGRGESLGALRVLADAHFAPHARFPEHGHRDMEILSVVVEGELSHHGSQAHAEVMPARTAQLISARNGITHAEGNDTDSPVRMLQLWFVPDELGGEPVYATRAVPKQAGQPWQPVAGDDGLPLRARARVDWLDLAAGQRVSRVLAPGARAYLVGIHGMIEVEGETVAVGEGAELTAGPTVLATADGASALWIELEGPPV